MGRNVEPRRDLVSYIKQLEKRIEYLERSQRIGNTAIDKGNVVVNNGAVVAKYPNGVELFRTGTGTTTLPFDTLPTQGYVTRFRRGNGNLVFEAFSTEDGGSTTTQFNDRNGNQILSEDWLIGKGLGRPFIPWHGYRASDWTTPPDIITASTFTAVYILEGNQQHPALYVNVRCVADAGTAGEIRLQDTFYGNTMWSATISAGFNGNLTGTGTINDLRNYGENQSLEIQARRTAGTGNLRFLLVMAYGSNALTL